MVKFNPGLNQILIGRRDVTSRYHGSTISGSQKTNDDGDGKENGKK